MLTAEQESALVGYMIEDFGTCLNHDDFVDHLLGMFEDIAGMENLTEKALLETTLRLWKIYQASTSIKY